MPTTPREAFVLAAGLGTRLRPLTEHRPKPLVPVCGVPLLAYTLALCARHGLRRVVVNAHWLADQLVGWEGEREGCDVVVSVELPRVLGTGGGLRNVRDRLAERFVVLNGDVLHDVDLTALRGAVPDGGGAMALRPHREDAPRHGIVAADETGTVVRLVRLASAEPVGAVAEDTHFTGIHALHRDALELVPEGEACIVRTAYTALVPRRVIAGMRYDGPWLDAGDPAAYLDANLAVLRREVGLALDPLPRARFAFDGVTSYGEPPDGVVVDGPVWIGHGARVGRGARLRDAIVGDGATVPDGAALDQVVVWDGATAPGALTRAIVHDGGVLPVG